MKTILVAAIAVFASQAALAGEMAGTIKSVDMEKKTIVLEDGMSVMANDNVMLDTLKPGDKVTVMTDDNKMATDVMMQK